MCTVTLRTQLQDILQRNCSWRDNLVLAYMVKPCLATRVEHKQTQMKVAHDGKRHQPRSFQPGNSVMVRSFRGSQPKVETRSTNHAVSWTCVLHGKKVGPTGSVPPCARRSRDQWNCVEWPITTKWIWHWFCSTDILVPPAVPPELPALHQMHSLCLHSQM